MTSKTFNALLLLMLTAVFGLTACSEDDNDVEEYPNWQSTNAAYWDSLYTATQAKIAAGDTSWRIIRSYSLEDTLATLGPTSYIIVNIKEEGDGEGSPLYTDSVRTRHSGRLLPSTSYPEGYVIDNTNALGADESSAGVDNSRVRDYNNGFITALQHMHIGDKWDVYIPWTLGYGTTQSSSSVIPAYSVLRFTIQLVAYSHPGSSLPPYKAKHWTATTE